MSLINKVYTAQDMRDAAKCLFACEVDLKHDNRDIAKMLRQAADMMDSANAAAMHEALVMVKRLFDGRLMWQPDIRKAHEAVNAALSAPPRNCDLLSDAQEALAAIHEDRGYVNNPIDERRLTVNWLFAEARLFDEAKGETK